MDGDNSHQPMIYVLSTFVFRSETYCASLSPSTAGRQMPMPLISVVLVVKHHCKCFRMETHSIWLTRVEKWKWKVSPEGEALGKTNDQNQCAYVDTHLASCSGGQVLFSIIRPMHRECHRWHQFYSWSRIHRHRISNSSSQLSRCAYERDWFKHQPNDEKKKPLNIRCLIHSSHTMSTSFETREAMITTLFSRCSSFAPQPTPIDSLVHQRRCSMRCLPILIAERRIRPWSIACFRLLWFLSSCVQHLVLIRISRLISFLEVSVLGVFTTARKLTESDRRSMTWPTRENVPITSCRAQGKHSACNASLIGSCLRSMLNGSTWHGLLRLEKILQSVILTNSVDHRFARRIREDALLIIERVFREAPSSVFFERHWRMTNLQWMWRIR